MYEQIINLKIGPQLFDERRKKLEIDPVIIFSKTFFVEIRNKICYYAFVYFLFTKKM